MFVCAKLLQISVIYFFNLNQSRSSTSACQPSAAINGWG